MKVDLGKNIIQLYILLLLDLGKNITINYTAVYINLNFL